jgi:predicted nucleotidyltransferase
LGEKIATRDVVIKTLVDALKPLDYVHAFYESGAIAFNRLDEWSDIDIYLVVDEQKVEDSFAAVEAALRSVSPIKQKFAIPQLPWPGVSQAFYKLERASEYLLIDLAVIKLSGPEKFLAPEIHGKAIFYFNKSDRVKVPSADKEELAKTVQQRFSRLKDRFAMFNIFVQKEMNRSNYLEALVLYYSLTLGSVVDALRIKYSPFHHDFKTRYMQYELPKHVVERIERLYFVKDGKDLRKKYREATEWFKTMAVESIGKERSQ